MTGQRTRCHRCRGQHLGSSPDMGWGNAMRKGLRKLQAGGILLRELRGIRKALERANDLKEQELAAQGWTQTEDPGVEAPPLMVTEVDSELANDMAVIELTLTRSLGMPPTEDQILAEYERLHTEEDDPRHLSVLEAGYRQQGRYRG